MRFWETHKVIQNGIASVPVGTLRGLRQYVTVVFLHKQALGAYIWCGICGVRDGTLIHYVLVWAAWLFPFNYHYANAAYLFVIGRMHKWPVRAATPDSSLASPPANSNKTQ